MKHCENQKCAAGYGVCGKDKMGLRRVWIEAATGPYSYVNVSRFKDGYAFSWALKGHSVKSCVAHFQPMPEPQHLWYLQ
jgi:hypothetical protein